MIVSRAYYEAPGCIVSTTTDATGCTMEGGGEHSHRSGCGYSDAPECSRDEITGCGKKFSKQKEI